MMPYIEDLGNRREFLKRRLLQQPLEFEIPRNAGELNYCITILCIEYLRKHGLKYQYLNDITASIARVQGPFTAWDFHCSVNRDFPERYEYHSMSSSKNLRHNISSLCWSYYSHNREKVEDVVDDIIGALFDAALEFYRRKIAPYEDQKIEQNGDVYDVAEKRYTGGPND